MPQFNEAHSFKLNLNKV